MNKLISLQQAASLINDGDTVAVGGTLCQRVPAAMMRELARRKVKNLNLVKASPGYDADILANAGCLSSVRAGIVSLEQPFGMSPGFRRAVENKKIKMIENACPAVMGSLQAAAYGLPFLPVAGLNGSDIRNLPQFKTITDPFSGKEVVITPAVRPDWAILFVHESDDRGNARIYGSPAWDVLMSRAAKNTILLADEIKPTDHFVQQPELTLIPEILVHSIVHMPKGAWPTSCYPNYDLDEQAMQHYLDLMKSSDGLQQYLDETSSRDHDLTREQ